ncbi:Tyrosinase [Dactylella cylindrospora]|nr:Tyrosinase [Dactylella cylindrospora]
MVSSKWAGSALVALLSISNGVLALPAVQYEADPDPIKLKERQATSTASAAAPAWGQCGGTGWTGPTVCITGYYCSYANAWYSQCLPGTGTATTRPTTTTTRTTTPVVYQTTTTSKTTTPIVYQTTTPPYGYTTTPPYGYTTTPPYGYTTPPYGYTTPGYTTPYTSTSSTRTTTTSSTKTSATPKYTPVVGANNTCYNRLKIETLQRSDPDQFNLLLLAWRKLQTAPDSDLFGHYQIAGIHGAPYVAWQMPPVGPYDYNRGYCTHGSVLFTSWHRPYLLLLEQALFHAANAIAITFTGTAQTQYLAAAARLRLPYWDWSDPVTQSYLPAITMQQTVTVTQPDGSGNPISATIPNPLWAYNFLSTTSIAPFNPPWNAPPRLSTRRYPTSSWGDQSNLASNAMQSGFAGRVVQTYNAFLAFPYNSFSNMVEGIHDAVHGALGGGGQMGTVAYSAFDPVFWLHHCNVDRLMAMYQASQPGTWISAAPAVGTFARPVPPNTVDDTNSELYPFQRADGSWWRSTHTNPVSTIWGMKYGYPEVPCSYQTRTPQELDTFATQQINTLYGRRRVPGISRDWQIRLLIDQAEIPGGYDIYVYGGTRPEDPYSDPYRQGYIGSLSSMSPAGTADQYKQSRIRYVDVSVNSYLQSQGYYEADPYKITSYISSTIYYTIVANGKPCAFEDLYTAKIGIYSRDVYDSGTPEILPYYTTDPYYYTNITEKIPGGIKTIEEITYPVKVDGTREVPWADLGNSTSNANSTKFSVV